MLLLSVAMKIDTGSKQPPVTSTPQGVYTINEVEEEIEVPTGVYLYSPLPSPSSLAYFHKLLTYHDIQCLES